MSDLHDAPDIELIRALLRKREAQRAAGRAIPEDPAERIARAVAAKLPEPTACVGVEAQLPEFVAAELRGAEVARLFPEVWHHLLTCEQCAAIHADLLELELGPEQEPLPVPALSALRWPVTGEALRQFVAGRARQVLTRLGQGPTALDELIQSFFEVVEELGENMSWSPRTARAFGFAGEESSGALRVLLATWQATLAVRDELARHPGLKAQRTRFEELLRQAAHRAARRNRLGRQATARFVQAFVELALPSEHNPQGAEDARPELSG